jgi:hypothetical protein
MRFENVAEGYHPQPVACACTKSAPNEGVLRDLPEIHPGITDDARAKAIRFNPARTQAVSTIRIGSLG